MEMIHLAVFMIHLACVLIHECYTLQVFTVLRKNQIKPLNQRENYFAAYVLKDATYDSTVRENYFPCVAKIDVLCIYSMVIALVYFSI